MTTDFIASFAFFCIDIVFMRIRCFPKTLEENAIKWEYVDDLLE